MSAPTLSLALSQALLRARLAARRTGGLALGAGLLAGAAAVGWGGMGWQALTQAVSQTPEQPGANERVPLPAPGPDPLAEFDALLGPSGQNDQLLRQLFAWAKRHQLVLAKGQYTPAGERQGQFQTYQIVLPVVGRYPDIWAFAQQVQERMPYAALTQISFQRDSVAEAQTQARLHFTLYLQPDAERRTP